MNNFSMFLCLIVTIAAVGATIFNRVCPDGIQYHHLCPNGKGIDIDNDCPPGTRIKHFGEAQRRAIVRAHNEKRNYVASGNDSRLDPACNMHKLSWKNQLAQDAAADIRQYKTASDPCDNTAALRNPKINVASWTFQYLVNETSDLISAVQSWYGEIQNVNQTTIDSYPENYNGPPINSFMAMMADSNNRVGCSGGVFYVQHRIHQREYIVVCRYDTSYVPGSSVYAKCITPGQNCRERATKYNNLCNS